MDLDGKMPLMVFDDKCYVCIKFAKMVNYLTKGRLRMVGHYTDFGKSIRDNLLGEDALEMVWFINKDTAYGGRAALRPLISAIFNLSGTTTNEIPIQESCDIGCKDSFAVFFRSASLITHSRKISLRNI